MPTKIAPTNVSQKILADARKKSSIDIDKKKKTLTDISFKIALADVN